MYFRVTFTGAALHLRSLSLAASGCGSGDFAVFSPSGFDGGHLVVPPWQYDPDHAPIYPSVAFSMFNAD